MLIINTLVRQDGSLSTGSFRSGHRFTVATSDLSLLSPGRYGPSGAGQTGVCCQCKLCQCSGTMHSAVKQHLEPCCMPAWSSRIQLCIRLPRIPKGKGHNSVSQASKVRLRFQFYSKQTLLTWSRSMWRLGSEAGRRWGSEACYSW